MKIICVPKNAQAQIDLDFDEAKQDELIELQLDDASFDDLQKSGFISLINRMIGSNIDSYEDETIFDLNKLIQISNSNLFDEQYYDSKLYQVIENIHTLFKKAIEFETGVYFYF